MSGWNESAEAWIADQADGGDWSRRHVLDPCLYELLEKEYGTPSHPLPAIDVGCGEGRFCRILRSLGFDPVGIDPTPRLIEEARRLDPEGEYRIGVGEALPFEDGAFALAVAYLSLLDIPDYRAAIREMARVLRPGGLLLSANIANHASTSAQGWVRDAEGNRLYYPVDNYGTEFEMWVEWREIRVKNWHRPLSDYMAAYLGAGLTLEAYLEPPPVGASAESMEIYRRVPWFSVMQWRKR